MTIFNRFDMSNSLSEKENVLSSFLELFGKNAFISFLKFSFFGSLATPAMMSVLISLVFA